MASLTLNSCARKNTPPELDKDFYEFSKDFLWGTATAAYQVEGGIKNDWSAQGHDAGNGVEHYQRFDEDFAHAKAMNTKAHRFSIEWSRIEPQKGQWDMKEVEHYRQVLKSLKKHGLKPMVTLHHFTNPIWLKEIGGWENEKSIELFNRYVKFIVNELKDDVDFWVTFNEPLVYAFKSYDSGEWPPKKTDRRAALEVIKHLIVAHGKAYSIIHKLQPTAKVGIAKHITILEPYFVLNPIDHLMASVQSNLFNNAFWDSIISGKVDLFIPGFPRVEIPFSNELKDSMDFIGVNYYMRWFITMSGGQKVNEDAPKTDLGWEIYPDGILKALRIANQYSKKLNGIPIYITENGLDDHADKIRSRFMLSHLYRLWQAQQEGIPVKGYMFWSLIDNFEWVEGYEPKFGLMDKDRKWRSSAHVYKEIASKNGISKDMYLKYPLY